MFGHLVSYGCLSSFRRVGYKLSVMVRKKTKQRRLNLSSSFFPFSVFLSPYLVFGKKEGYRIKRKNRDIHIRLKR